MSLYMLCFIALLQICWCSWAWSKSERVRKPRIEERPGKWWWKLMRLYREVWSTTQTVRFQRSYIFCPKGILRNNFRASLFFHFHLDFPVLLLQIASFHLLSHNPVYLPLFTSPYLHFPLLFSLYLSHFLFFHPFCFNTWPLIICPTLLPLSFTWPLEMAVSPWGLGLGTQRVTGSNPPWTSQFEM